MSLKSKISILKTKADNYNKLNIEHIELQHKYDNLDNNYSELQKKYNQMLTQQNIPNIIEKDNMIQYLQTYINDINYNYKNFQNYYNNLCNTLNISTNNEIQLQQLLNEKEKEINKLKNNQQNNQQNNITNNEYTTLLNGFYKKEQIMATKLQNIINEMNTLQEENESLKDDISNLIGNIDDLKGNKLIIEKNKEIKRLNMEIDNLELYIDQKEIIIEEFLDLNLKEKLNQKENEFNSFKKNYELEKSKFINYNFILSENIKKKSQEILVLKKEIDEYKNILHSSDDDNEEDDEEEEEEDDEEDDDECESIEEIEGETVENEWCLLNEKIEIIIQ